MPKLCKEKVISSEERKKHRQKIQSQRILSTLEMLKQNRGFILRLSKKLNPSI